MTDYKSAKTDFCLRRAKRKVLPCKEPAAQSYREGVSRRDTLCEWYADELLSPKHRYTLLSIINHK